MNQLNVRRGLTVCLVTMLAGCAQEAPDMTTPPPPVRFAVVAPKDLVHAEELQGRVSALRTAEIRAQVGGIVHKRLFEQGSEVKAGQPLFQINPAPFKADVDTSAASLQRAEAALARATNQASRLKPLADTEAVSRQTYDDAESQRQQAAAEVAQARAELSRRQLDLRFATIEAPISGRIDQAQVSEGALATPTDGAPLAKVQQIDQVYVDVRQPVATLEKLQHTVEIARQAGKAVKVEILKNSGEPFGLSGNLLFSGITVEEGTGDVLVRVLVSNTQRRLLPGMFVKARIPLAELPQAISIPQHAVSRAGSGTKAWRLDEQNRVHQVNVELGELIDRRYVVRSGLKPGDRVVIEGLDRMKEGVEVTPQDIASLSNGNNSAVHGGRQTSPQAN